MTLRSPCFRYFAPRFAGVFALTLLSGPGSIDRTAAQGLSGPPQRLEETLGRAEPPSSGAAPTNTGSSQTPTAGQYGVGSSSGPPSGYGSGSSAPPPGYGSSSSGPPSGYSGSSAPPPGYGSSSGPPSGYGSSSGPPSGYGGSSAPPGYGNDPSGYGMGDEMDSMYGGGYGGNSRSRPLVPNSDAMQTYASSLISALAAIDVSPLFAPAEATATPTGPVLLREAEQAFKAGNQAVALNLMFGHMATEYEDASAALRSVKYSQTLRRPVWSIRWGIALDVRGDAVDDPSPIREGATPNRSQLAGGGRGGRGQAGGYEADYGAEMMESMDDMQDEMEDMDSTGDMEDMGMEMEMEMGGMSGRRRPTNRPANVPSIPEREMLSSSVGEQLDKTLGLVATVIAEEFEKRYTNGDFGPLLTSVSAPEPVAPVRRFPGQPAAAPTAPSMSMALNEVLLESDEPIPMWKPGIVFLGEGTEKEILPAARAANIDLILHFSVGLKSRNEQVQNISRCRLFDVATPKTLVLSKAIDSFEAARMAAAGRMGEREYVEEQLKKLFEVIDEDIKVTELPTLSADVARRRIASLITSRSLRTLAEIRLFQAQGLLNQSEVEAAFEIVGGEDGLKLLHGPLEERLAIARSWAAGKDGPGASR